MMTNAASTSNPSFIVNVGEAYPYPSLINPNIVTVKLSGKNKYNMWKTQMLCLLKSHQMDGFIDGQFPRPAGNGKGKVEDTEAWTISDSLVKGWILGSLSEEAFNKVVNHLTHNQKNPDFTAKDLWDELQRTYGPRVREQAAETKLTPRRQAESVIEVNSISEDAKSKDEPKEEKTEEEKLDEISNDDIGWLYYSIRNGITLLVIDQLNKFGLNPRDKLTNNGNTVLHVTVGSSTKNHKLLKKLLEMTPKENTLLDLINSNGSSLLHVVAIGGNIEAVDILVERNPELLLVTDKEGHIPLALSVSNMHIKTSHCLFEHMKVHGYAANLFSGQSGEELVILAISCQDFSLAEKTINEYPDAILSGSDDVLTTLAQNFPRELSFWERRDFMGEFEDRLDPNLFSRFVRSVENDSRCVICLYVMMMVSLTFLILGSTLVRDVMIEKFNREITVLKADELELTKKAHEIRSRVAERDLILAELEQLYQFESNQVSMLQLNILQNQDLKEAAKILVLAMEKIDRASQLMAFVERLKQFPY